MCEYTYCPVQNSSISFFAIENSSLALNLDMYWLYHWLHALFCFAFLYSGSHQFFVFLFLSLDSFPNSMVLGYIRTKASPFPMRLQDIGQSRIVRRKHEDLLAKRSGFESQFHLISLLRSVNLIICTNILIQCWCSTNGISFYFISSLPHALLFIFLV